VLKTDNTNLMDSHSPKSPASSSPNFIHPSIYPFSSIHLPTPVAVWHSVGGTLLPLRPPWVGLSHKSGLCYNSPGQSGQRFPPSPLALTYYIRILTPCGCFVHPGNHATACHLGPLFSISVAFYKPTHLNFVTLPYPSGSRVGLRNPSSPT
jgi:hypothetical protein